MPNKIFPIGGEGTKGPESHVFSYTDGMEMHHATAKERSEFVPNGKGFNHISFHGESVRWLLSHPGCAGLRIYPGKCKGRDTLVLCAVDAAGNDIQTVALQAGHPCPPFCGQ